MLVFGPCEPVELSLGQSKGILEDHRWGVPDRRKYSDASNVIRRFSEMRFTPRRYATGISKRRALDAGWERTPPRVHGIGSSASGCRNSDSGCVGAMDARCAGRRAIAHVFGEV